MATPRTRLVAVIAFGIIVVFFAVKIALLQPFLRFSFQPGDILKSSTGEVVLESLELMPEPGELSSHTDLNKFYERQNLISNFLNSEFTVYRQGEEPKEIVPGVRAVADLHFLFWIQILVGLGALVISGWIWSLRSQDLATRLFAFSGFSTFVSAILSAVYTTRELVIPSPFFPVLEALNAAGAAMFGISMLALFMVYPMKLKRGRQIAFIQGLVVAVWTSLYLLQLTPHWANISLIIVVEMLAICIAIGFQFWATKRDPKARASLTWLGLSVLLGAGAFVVFNTVPLLLKTTPLNQGYAFTFFLIIYFGLAAGLTQYRLFEVGQWAFRLLFYAVGALALVAFDATLIYLLGMDRLPALGLALLAVGFVYLPLRDYFWRKFSKQGRMESDELLAESLHVAFAPSSALRAHRWELLLRKIFEPLQIETIDIEVGKVEVAQDGLVLLIPPVASTSSLKISYPWSGQSLFTTQSQKIANQIVSLIQQAESNRESYDRGVTEERLRMAQDLHDDVGARLLTGLYIADEKLKPTLQGAIADIRSIVSGMTGENISLDRLMADLRYEAARRLSAVHVNLDWPVSESSEEEKILDYRQHKAISSALREVISNVIRHAEASSVEVQIQTGAESLEISIEDNGKGLSQSMLTGDSLGYGLKSLRRRVEDIGGRIEIKNLSPGTCIRLTIPFVMIYN